MKISPLGGHHMAHSQDDMLQTELALYLPPPLLALHFLSQFLGIFSGGLFALFALSLFVQRSAFHDPGDNLGGVDILEAVVANLTVNVHGLGHSVGVELERHKCCLAVVDGQGGGVGECVEEGFAKREGGAKDGGVDVL